MSHFLQLSDQDTGCPISFDRVIKIQSVPHPSLLERSRYSVSHFLFVGSRYGVSHSLLERKRYRVSHIFLERSRYRVSHNILGRLRYKVSHILLGRSRYRVSHIHLGRSYQDTGYPTSFLRVEILVVPYPSWENKIQGVPNPSWEIKIQSGSHPSWEIKIQGVQLKRKMGTKRPNSPVLSYYNIALWFYKKNIEIYINKFS